MFLFFFFLFVIHFIMMCVFFLFVCYFCLVFSILDFVFFFNLLNSWLFSLWFFSVLWVSVCVRVGCLFSFCFLSFLFSSSLSFVIRVGSFNYSSCSKKFGDLKYSGTESSIRDITLYMDFFHDCSVSLPPCMERKNSRNVCSTTSRNRRGTCFFVVVYIWK